MEQGQKVNREKNSILEKKARESWEKLEISNDFLFGKIMQDKELCKNLLEMILEVKIEKIEYPEIQKSICVQEEGKGVRLDVYVADENHTVYNVEMQAANTYELPERSRYYQGIIDMDLIAKGESYRTLKKSYIIFICTFDLFGEGLYKYTFENRCKENPEISLEDGTQKIFLNATGLLEEAGEDMKAFLEYVKGKESENEFVQRVKTRAVAVKQNVEWRSDYMMQQIRENLKYEQGIERGIEQGIEQGRIVERIEMLRELGMTKAEIMENVQKKFGVTREEVEKYLAD